MKTIESGTPNTLCPYLARPLSDGFPTNEEHVLPDALGAPSNFTVPASLAENSRLNELVDAPMINDPLVKAFSMFAEIETCTSSKAVTVHGTNSLGDNVVADITKDAVSPRFRNPVVKDKGTGRIVAVRGFDSGVVDEARKIRRRLMEKGHDLSGAPPIMAIEDTSELKLSLVSDLLLLRREAIKIAYLLTVKGFGDAAIASESGRIFRAAIEAATDETLAASGLQRMVHSWDDYGIDLQVKHHLLTTTLDSAGFTTLVVLFGGISFLFRTPREDVDREDCRYGKLIDASARRFIDRP